MRDESDKRPLTKEELLHLATCLDGVAASIRGKDPVHHNGELHIDLDYELRTVRIHGDILLQLRDQAA